MSKFALLAVFLMIILSWINQPFKINPTDEMLDKYRPSMNNKVRSVKTDSTYVMETAHQKKTTAMHIPQAKKLILKDH